MTRARQKTATVNLDSGGPIVSWDPPEAGKLHRGLVLTTEVCPNPDCPCREVTVNVFAVDERFEAIEPSGRVKYRIDPTWASEALPTACLSAAVHVDTGLVTVPEETPPERREPALLDKLRELLAEGPLFERVQRRWRAAKRESRELWKTRDWTGWEPGEMVAWTELFPDDPQFLFRNGDGQYWAEDYYCANPDCDCEEVLFNLVRIEKGRTAFVGAFYADVRRLRTRGVEGGEALPDSIRKLWKALKEAIPELGRELRKRRKAVAGIAPELSRLASRNRRSGGLLARFRDRPQGVSVENESPVPSARTAASSGGKPGRNDPCPCGSGRKYKKCCAARR